MAKFTQDTVAIQDGGPLRVLVGKDRFSENHAWSEMPQHWPSGVADRAVIEVVGQGQLERRLVDGGPPVDVVVPMWSPLPGRAIRAPLRSFSRWRGASPKRRRASSRADGESPLVAHSLVRRPASSAPEPSAPRSPVGSLPST
jgi:hypothetical protein